MSTTSKSPRRVLLTAYAIGRSVLPNHRHRFAPKTFTQPQRFACLVLKARMKQDYRGITALLQDAPALCAAIKLKRVPHFTTLQKVAHRLLRSHTVARLLATTVQCGLGRRRCVETAGADSSGFDLTHASRYYVWRRGKRKNSPQKRTTYRWFGKLQLLSDCRRHLILSTYVCRGPCPDVHQLRDLLAACVPGLKLNSLVADAGYDSESNHVMLREEKHIRSVIPAKHGRPSKDGKPPTGRWRRLMRKRFNHRAYRERSQTETVFSMIKRNLGGTLGARSYWSQQREMLLKVLTHNIGILWCAFRGFLQSLSGAFDSPDIGYDGHFCPAYLACTHQHGTVLRTKRYVGNAAV
jgi:transposase